MCGKGMSRVRILTNEPSPVFEWRKVEQRIFLVIKKCNLIQIQMIITCFKNEVFYTINQFLVPLSSILSQLLSTNMKCDILNLGRQPVSFLLTDR